MVRYINLTDYIPEFMKDYRELVKLLDSETEEFRILADKSEQLKNNQFINYCNAEGISKFESMLKITPDAEDNLATRIARVIMKWNSELPYTLNGIKKKLTSLCGDDYLIVPQFEKYTLKLVVSLPLKTQVDDLTDYLKSVLPANMDFLIENIINKTTNNKTYAAGDLITTIINQTIESEMMK